MQRDAGDMGIQIPGPQVMVLLGLAATGIPTKFKWKFPDETWQEIWRSVQELVLKVDTKQITV